MSELGLELEERDGGIFITDVQEHGCVAVHGMFSHVSVSLADFLVIFSHIQTRSFPMG